MTTQDLPAPLDVEISTDGATVVLSVVGELDIAANAVVRDAVTEAFRHGAPRVALDCERLGFIDSTGLALLIDAHRIADRAGAEFVLRNPSKAVRALLAVTGLNNTLTIEGSERRESFGAA